MTLECLGIVSPSVNGHWLGGMYHLHHIVAALHALPEAERPRLRDVWWNGRPDAVDYFAEVRTALLPPAELRLPVGVVGRAWRAARRWAGGYQGDTLEDVFHAAGIRALFPIAPCERMGVPFIGWVQDFQFKHLTGYYTTEQLTRFHADFVRPAGQASRLMVNCEDVLKDVRQFYPEFLDKCTVIRPVSVRTSSWLRADPLAVAGRLGLPERFFLISNQICAHKNHATVFEALESLNRRGQRLHVVCSGNRVDYRDPEFFERLQSLVRQRGLESQVTFVGSVPREDYFALMRRALAVIQPSEFEGWGFAMADANALGKIVLASDIPVHREHEGVMGSFIPVHDVAAWADALAEADRTCGPGPNLAEENRARLRNEADALRFGRQLKALFAPYLS